METAMGKSILGQIAFGRLRFLRRPEQDVTEFSQLSWEEEIHRFHTAQSLAVDFPACKVTLLVGLVPLLLRQKGARVQGIAMLALYAGYLTLVI